MRLNASLLSAAISIAPSVVLAQSNTFPASGNVGVGTTSPSAKLTVVANTGSAHASTVSLRSPSGTLGATPGLSFYPTFASSSDTTPRRAADLRAGFDLGTWGTEFLAFHVGGPSNDGGNLTKERMRLTAAGFLGVGTSRPRSLVDVVGDTAFFSSWLESSGQHDLAPAGVVSITSGSLVEGGPTARGAQSHWLISASGATLGIDFGSSYMVSDLSFGAFWRTDPRFAPASYSIDTSVDGVTWNQRVLVSGNQGTEMVHKLNVTARYLRITVTQFQSGQTIAAISGLQIFTKDLGAGASTGKPLWASASNSSDIFLNTTGKVGIGTKSPTHTLSVNGTVRAKEVLVETAGWADYVFSSDYQVPSLAETEAHIAAHGHLPGLPSAAEVTERGISVAEMQGKLLAKIEELTLHQIALDKRVRGLEVENAALRTQLSNLTQP